jgi:uracil-DNA glycosylase
VDRDLAELATCTRCALARTRTRVVVGSGPPDPTLMIVGEAPGRTEDEGGEPFIGRSGQLLFRLVEEETGLTRAQCFVTNAVKCRPPGNRTPRASELEACRPWLVAQTNATTPRVVLALGLTAAREVLGSRAPMGEVHGVVHRLASGPALATYHPAAALRTPSVVDVIRRDLRIVADLIAAS